MIRRLDIIQGMLVNYEGIILQVQPQQYNEPSCLGCYFSTNEAQKRGENYVSCSTHGLICTASMRKDRKHVIFREIPVIKI